jgi:superkiller protein 3
MRNQNTFVAALLSTAVLGSALLVGCKSSSQATVGGRPQGIDLYVAGVRAYQSGDEAAAISNLVAATEANDRLIMATSLLADLYKSQGNYEQSRDLYGRVAQLDPYSYGNFYNLGLTHQLLQQLNDAASNYQRALTLKDDHLESNMNLGLVRLALGNNDQAIASLRRATEIDPNNAAAWANLGVALDAKGEYAEAERAYRTSIDLRSDQRSTLLNLGGNLVRQQKTNEAIGILQQALTQGDDAFVHKLLGDAFTQASRFDEATKHYDLALQQNPRYANAMAEKANALIAKYKKDLELDESLKAAAIDLWKKSLEINPQQPRVRESIERWSKQGM